jgi:hypothetical protein
MMTIAKGNMLFQLMFKNYVEDPSVIKIFCILLQVLLKNPDLVSDTWLNFASALWFFVTPQAGGISPETI